MTINTSEDISWSNCIGIYTDGTASLTGHKKGFQAEVRQVDPHVNFINCRGSSANLDPVVLWTPSKTPWHALHPSINALQCCACLP
jgi:hypothetical protein